MSSSMDISERIAKAISVAIKILVIDSNYKDPLKWIRWLRKITVLKETENSVRIGIVFWINANPSDWEHKIVIIDLNQKPNGWIPVLASLSPAFVSLNTSCWDFGDRGKPVKR